LQKAILYTNYSKTRLINLPMPLRNVKMHFRTTWYKVMNGFSTALTTFGANELNK